MIDSKAVIDPSAKIAEDVTIGPWTVIGPDVEIGSGTWIGPHVVINGPTKIGRENKIFQFASVGEVTQDKKYHGEETWLEIGDHNTIREFCTLNRGTGHGGGVTKIGDDNLFMAYVHIAHDCIIGNHTVFANNASLAGHVKIADYVIMGGFSAAGQFCSLGEYSFASAGSLIDKDVLPYIKVSGHFARPFGLNVIGLKRNNFDLQTIRLMRQAYRIIYRSELTVEKAIQQLEPLVPDCSAVQLMIDGLRTSERGIAR